MTFDQVHVGCLFGVGVSVVDSGIARLSEISSSSTAEINSFVNAIFKCGMCQWMKHDFKIIFIDVIDREVEN